MNEKVKTGSIIDSLAGLADLAQKSTGFKSKDLNNVKTCESKKIKERRRKNKEARKTRRSQRKNKK